jgi:hypothetical protein
MRRSNLFRVVRHDLTDFELFRRTPEFRPTPCWWIEVDGQRINPCSYRVDAEEICKILNATARRWAKEGGK